MKNIKIKLLLFSAMLAISVPEIANAESTFHGAFPNIHGKSITTPVGWGAAYGTVFAGVGGTTPAPYSDVTDAAACIGVGLGDPVKHIGIEASLMSLDMSAFDRFAANIKVHHYLGHGNSIAVGVENIILKDAASPSDSGKSYYIVYSQGVQSKKFIDKTDNRTKLHYSIGIGNGRYKDLSPQDQLAGKGTHGTAVFGNIAYEMCDQFNGIAEWNGVNLNAGVSKTILLSKRSVIVANIGAGDLTRYSGDKIRLIWSFGGGIMF